MGFSFLHAFQLFEDCFKLAYNFVTGLFIVHGIILAILFYPHNIFECVGESVYDFKRLACKFSVSVFLKFGHKFLFKFFHQATPLYGSTATDERFERCGLCSLGSCKVKHVDLVLKCKI